MDETQFQLLRQEVQGPRAFDIRAGRASEIAKRLEFEKVSEAAALLASLEFLYDRAHTSTETEDDPKDILRGFLTATDIWSSMGDQPDNTLERLGELVVENTAYETNEKRQWLQTGILDNATSFASFVDLRPSFAKDRSRIDEIIPTIIFGIETEREFGEEKTCVFQLTETALRHLGEAVKDASEKIKTLKADERLRYLLVDDEKSDENK